jgi:formylmethanofuran dehydrogenase subunit E
MSNYPPGTTEADIDRRAGEYKVVCPRCYETVMAYDITDKEVCYVCEEKEQEQPRERNE